MRKQHYLTRRDILTMVNDIHEDLVKLFDCEACFLFFPKENEIKKATYLPDEGKLLLPLKFKNSTDILGVFLLRKPNAEKVKNLLPSIENFVNMALEKLYLKKLALYDPNTDLFTKHTLLHSLTNKIIDIRESFTKPAEFNPNPYFSSGAAGLVYFKLVGLKEHAKKLGHAFAEQCLQTISEKILSELPHDSILARVNEFDCALMLTEENCDGRMELNEFIYKLCNNLTSISFVPPETALAHNKRINVNITAGYIIFPQDYDNIVANREPIELAHALISNAAYAAHRASEQKKTFLPFSFLIQEGGNITKILTHNQMIINLGRNVGLREAMRFSVYENNPNIIDAISDENEFFDKQNMYKGDISLIEIHDEFALAEPIITHDPAYTFAENDFLIKLPDDFISTANEQQKLRKDSLTQLYSYPEFLSLFAEERQKTQNFSLALLSIESYADSPQIQITTLLSEIMQYILQHFIPANELEQYEKSMIFSRYGESNILCFIPHTEKLNENTTIDAYKTLSLELSRLTKRKISVGIALHPHMHYKSSEAIENAKKALECAKLLDEPHVSYCDSIALTISADKLATQGMLFDALQEYQYAILADEQNALAHNSLGVTLVSLKRFSEAQNTFLKALELTPSDISIYYNLGGISEKLGEISEAKMYYKKCLDSPEYSYFAYVRLGLISESENNIPQAIDYYDNAIKQDMNQASPYRQLAKIALQKNDITKARENLYTALRYTPNDAYSLILLAKIYLENNEDPNVISALLAPIMTQRQNNVDAWKMYAQALKAQGREFEAAQAELKVQNLVNDFQ